VVAPLRDQRRNALVGQASACLVFIFVGSNGKQAEACSTEKQIRIEGGYGESTLPD
jgi:hypothetical protein